MNEKAGSVLAHRCDICKELQPHLAELVQQPEYDPVQFLTIDVDALPRAAEQACHPRRSSVHRGGGGQRQPRVHVCIRVHWHPGPNAGAGWVRRVKWRAEFRRTVCGSPNPSDRSTRPIPSSWCRKQRCSSVFLLWTPILQFQLDSLPAFRYLLKTEQLFPGFSGSNLGALSVVRAVHVSTRRFGVHRISKKRAQKLGP